MEQFYPTLKEIAESSGPELENYSLFSIIEKPTSSATKAGYDHLDVECVGCFGHIDRHEKPLVAALRETFEESAFSLKTEWATTRPKGMEYISTDPITTTDFKGRSLIGFIFVVPRTVAIELKKFRVSNTWGASMGIGIEASRRYNG